AVASTTATPVRSAVATLAGVRGQVLGSRAATSGGALSSSPLAIGALDWGGDDPGSPAVPSGGERASSRGGVGGGPRGARRTPRPAGLARPGQQSTDGDPLLLADRRRRERLEGPAPVAEPDQRVVFQRHIEVERDLGRTAVGGDFGHLGGHAGQRNAMARGHLAALAAEDAIERPPEIAAIGPDRERPIIRPPDRYGGGRRPPATHEPPRPPPPPPP